MLLLWLLVSISSVYGYINPVITPDSPDPGVMYFRGRWYVATTTVANDGGDAFPIHVSDNLVDWKFLTFVFPKDRKPHWAKSDFWAPELHIVNDRVHVYFTARNTAGVLSIGVATADTPAGPYTPPAEPLVTDARLGNIDSTYVEDDGKKYLVWKLDGNGATPQIPCKIFARELRRDGLTFASNETTALIVNDLPWEGAVVEGPWLFYRQGTWFLFYSANGYDRVGPNGTCYYSVGVAKSTTNSVLGPYKKYPQPILSSVYSGTGIPFTGPGHCSVVSWNRNTDYMVYHAWSTGKVGAGHPRHMMLDVIDWQTGWPIPSNGHPSYTEQPNP